MNKRKEQHIARQVYLGSRGLEIDGVHLPWHIDTDVDLVDVMGGGRLFGLTVTFFADRVIINSPNGEHPDRDTLLEACREEARQIVRDGLADIIAQLPTAQKES